MKRSRVPLTRAIWPHSELRLDCEIVSSFHSKTERGRSIPLALVPYLVEGNSTESKSIAITLHLAEPHEQERLEWVSRGMAAYRLAIPIAGPSAHGPRTVVRRPPQ